MTYYKNSILIAAIYFFAIFLLSFVSLILSTQDPGWNTLLFGLIIGSIGSIITFILLKNWEISLSKTVRYGVKRDNSNSDSSKQEAKYKDDNSHIDIEKQKEEIDELNEKNDLLHKMEKDGQQFEQKIEDINHELETLKINSEEELRRKTVLLSEYQETINQQREVIKKRQDQISELESKVQDLNYEVKTLLQLAEIGNNMKTSTKDFSEEQLHIPDIQEDPKTSKNHKVTSSEEATNLLKRCVDTAQKITGANHFSGGQSRFRDLPIENYALDQRRLFDALCNENQALVFLFSPKENRLLFANNQTNNLLGLNPDKFLQDFSTMIKEKETEWKNGIYQLSASTQSKIRLLMKTKNGQDLLVNCSLGKISTGIFRNHIVGVLYSS